MKRIILTIAVLLGLAWPASAACTMPSSMGIPDFSSLSGTTKTAATGATNFSAMSPGSGDNIVIPSGATTTMDRNSATALQTICVQSGGTLIWQTTGTTLLVFEQLLVEDGGTLTMGTSGAPITGSATLRVSGVLHASSTSDLDPGQWGMGLLVAGTWNVKGTTKDRFKRIDCAADDGVDAGVNSITLTSVPTGWKSGDEIVIPDSTQRTDRSLDTAIHTPGTQYAAAYTANYAMTMDPVAAAAAGNAAVTKLTDRMVLSSDVSTTTASFTGNTTYSHPGGMDGSAVTVMCPHAINTSSNIKIESGSPSGTRGHIAVLDMAAINVQDVEISNMGRTTVEDLDCSLRTTGAANDVADCTEGTGAWTHVGTNQKGRYALHLHMVMGPMCINDGLHDCYHGFQGYVKNVSIHDSLKWSLAIHRTNYQDIEGNAITFGHGPLVMFEDGWENFNLIKANIACESDSTFAPRGFDAPHGTGGGAREASGFWMRTGNNDLIDNVVCALRTHVTYLVEDVAYKIFNEASGGDLRVPKFRGADVSSGSDYYTVDAREMKLRRFDNNEAYQMSDALTMWNFGTGSQGGINDDHYPKAASTVSNLTAWAIYSEMVYTYGQHQIVYDHLRMYGDPSPEKIFNYYTTQCGVGPLGFDTGDYFAYDNWIVNSEFHNVYAAMCLGSDPGPLHYINSQSWGVHGIIRQGYNTPGTFTAPVGWDNSGGNVGVGANPGTATRHLYIDNVVHHTVGSYPFSPIVMWQDKYNSGDTIMTGSVAFPDSTIDDQYWPALPDNLYVTRYQGGTANFTLHYIEQKTNNYGSGMFSGCDTTTYPEFVEPVYMFIMNSSTEHVPGGCITDLATFSGAPGYPDADYKFWTTTSSVTPNTAPVTATWPAIPNMDIVGSDVIVDADGLSINLSNTTYTHTDLMSNIDDLTHGITDSFPNHYDSGTVAMRFRIDDYLIMNGVIGTLMGWRVDPEPGGDFAIGPMQLDIEKHVADAASMHAPALKWARQEWIPQGASYHQNMKLITPGTLTDETNQFNDVVFTWSPNRLQISINGGAFLSIDPEDFTPSTSDVAIYPTPNYGHNASNLQMDDRIHNFVMWLGVLKANLHVGEMAYFQGTYRRMLIYPYEVSSADVAALSDALDESGSGGSPSNGVMRRFFRGRFR